MRGVQQGRDARAGRELAPAMLAVVREHGPISMNDALRRLKAERRCRLGVTLSAGMTACVILEMEGRIRPRDGLTLQRARFEWEAL